MALIMNLIKMFFTYFLGLDIIDRAQLFLLR
jgi:hypothetical protein